MGVLPSFILTQSSRVNSISFPLFLTKRNMSERTQTTTNLKVEDTTSRHWDRSYLRINSDRAFRGSGREDGEGALALDPISPVLVGKLRVDKLLNTVKQLGGPEWHTTLKQVFIPECFDGWCGRKAGFIAPALQVTRSDLQGAVSQLVAGGVLEEIDKRQILRNAAVNRDFVTIFLVPKDERKARAIGNCKSLNDRFAKGPRLSFATMEDLFRIVTFFGRQTFFATADFRHWFYQIPLPVYTRSFFTVVCQEKTCRFTVWPMGFSWSPFVAQGLSMLIAWLAIQAQQDVKAVSLSTSEADLPPFWLIVKRNTVGKPARTDIRGFIVFWYDNLLLVADSLRLRDNIRKLLARVAQDHHALWKSVEAKETFEESQAFVSTQDQVTYLGICFRRDKGKWSWQHVEKNLTKWGEKAATIPNEQGVFTWRDLTFLSGVLTWDWTVSGRDRAALGVALQISLKVGKQQIEDHEWRSNVQDTKEWLPMIMQAKSQIRSVLAIGPQHRLLESVEPFRHKTFLASDACDTSGAWVNLCSLRVCCEPFNMGEKAMHINWKETLWAIRALEAAVKTCQENTLVKIGVDNTTAVCALQHRVVGFNAELDTRMQSVLESYRNKKCLWVVHHIAGDLQPADEPSRNQGLDQKKVEDARSFLAGKADEWFHWVEEQHHERIGDKRGRTLDEIAESRN